MERGCESAQRRLNETTYRTWFDDVEGLELTDDEFVLAVPNDFTREWIEGHFLGLIQRRRARRDRPASGASSSPSRETDGRGAKRARRGAAARARPASA